MRYQDEKALTSYQMVFIPLSCIKPSIAIMRLPPGLVGEIDRSLLIEAKFKHISVCWISEALPAAGFRLNVYAGGDFV
jgi:hypothetical protein